MKAPAGRRALTTVFLITLLDLIGFGMILPLLPFYAQELHVTPFQIGLLFSSYSLAQLFFAPLVGRLSDRIGRRPVLLGSIAGGVAAYLLFAWASSYAVMLLARGLSGAAANYAVAQAYMADISTRENRARAMGLVGAAFGLGFVLGPALGGILAEFGEPRLVPLSAAALSSINFVIALFGLPESLPPESRGRRDASWLDVASLRAVWRDVPLRGLMALFFLVVLCFSMMETTLALFCQQFFGFGRRETSWLFVFVGIVLVVVQGGLLGRLVKRFGERRLIISGIFLMTLGLVLLPLTHRSVPWLLAGLFLLAVGQGIHNPSSLGLLSRLTGEGSQGSVIGVSRSFGALSRSIGPAAGTWIFGALGADWPFWTAGGLMLIALAVAFAVLRKVPVA